MPDHDWKLHRPDPATNSFTTDFRRISQGTDNGVEYLWDAVGPDRGKWTLYRPWWGIETPAGTATPMRTGLRTAWALVDGRALVYAEITLATTITALHLGLPVACPGTAASTSCLRDGTPVSTRASRFGLHLTGSLTAGRYTISAHYLAVDAGHSSGQWVLGTSRLGHDTITTPKEQSHAGIHPADTRPVQRRRTGRRRETELTIHTVQRMV
ncbi:MAG: hypothetical protein ACRD0P_14260 [Stackebrandtia sp.]